MAVVLARGEALASLYKRALAIVVGLTLALSSTAFAIQVMAEKNQLTTRHGRAAFSVLLFQDLAVIPLLALIPLFGTGGGEGSFVARTGASCAATRPASASPSGVPRVATSSRRVRAPSGSPNSRRSLSGTFVPARSWTSVSSSRASIAFVTGGRVS